MSRDDTETLLRFVDPAQAGSNASGRAAGAAFKSLKDGVLSVFDTQLSALYASTMQDSPTAAILTSGDGRASDAASAQQYVVIDATSKNGDGAALLDDLAALGLKEGGSFGDMASGLLPIGQIGALLNLTDLSFARASDWGSSAGSVDSQAGPALNADAARTLHSVNGGGVTVGVLSDSFDNRGGMSTDIASRDLPAATSILSDMPSGGTDEGRAMAQIVHDVAPGSPILFATAFSGIANFANSIIDLANAGAEVIVDDVLYFAETAFQDGPIAQAVDQVAASGVSYFSSAGNNDSTGYEAPFIPSGVTGPFDESLAKLTTATDGQYLPVTIPRNATVRFILHWDQPAQSVSGGAGTQNDLDLFLYNSSNTLLSQAVSDNVGHDPFESITYTNNSTSTSFKLAVGHYSGVAPGDFKLMALGPGASVALGPSSLNTNVGTLYGHAAADGAIAVAAASYADTPAYGTNPPVVEDFSSEGPTRILFDTAGHALGTPDVRRAPEITAPDGGDTTFFGSDANGNGLPNFFGTSAAAPAAGAVAALMLQANGALTPSDIANLLMDSAIDMDNPTTAGFDAGSDARTGAGLIQADKAVGFADTLQITGTAGNDLLLGTHLADTLDGAAGADRLDGKGGADELIGGAGTDTMKGGAGSDTLTGGGGSDRLYGGWGAEEFSYRAIGDSAPSGADGIYGFSGVTGSGEGDRLGLAELEASLNQSFTFRADGRFHGASGDIRSYVNAAGNTAVELDATGDSRADFRVMLAGSHAISANDLIF